MRECVLGLVFWAAALFRQCRRYLHFYQTAVVQFGNWNHRTGRLMVAKKFGINLVERGPVLNTGNIGGALHDVCEGAAS